MLGGRWTSGSGGRGGGGGGEGARLVGGVAAGGGRVRQFAGIYWLLVLVGWILMDMNMMLGNLKKDRRSKSMANILLHAHSLHMYQCHAAAISL